VAIGIASANCHPTMICQPKDFAIGHSARDRTGGRQRPFRLNPISNGCFRTRRLEDQSGESSPQLGVTKTGDTMLRRLLASSVHLGTARRGLRPSAFWIKVGSRRGEECEAKSGGGWQSPVRAGVNAFECCKSTMIHSRGRGPGTVCRNGLTSNSTKRAISTVPSPLGSAPVRTTIAWTTPVPATENRNDMRPYR
jgi:hypothetical protein